MLREQVEAVASDRDRVLAAVGHDVRTPMNSILGICALLLEEGELADAQRVWIERIDASCEALLAMLNGLLEIASGAGNAELQPAEVDVAGLVDEVSGVLAPQAHDKGLEIRTRFDDAVHGQLDGRPDAAAPGAVQSGEQCDQVHRQRLGRNPRLRHHRRRWPDIDPARGVRYRLPALPARTAA